MWKHQRYHRNHYSVTESRRVEEVYVVKMAKFGHDLRSQNDKVMKKIEIKNENIVMNLLKKGFKVEGRLWLEETEDGEFIIWFDRYNRKPQPKQRNWLIRRLEHGWVKESVERIKVYESIPKEIGTPRILAVIDRETKEAKDALMEHELDMLEFC